MSDKEWTQYYNLLNGIEPEPTIEERIEDAILGSTITEVTTNITKAMTSSKVDREVVLTMRVDGIGSYEVERSGAVAIDDMHKRLYALARKELRTHFEIVEDLAG